MRFEMLADISRAQARERGGKVAFVFGTRRSTYADLDHAANRVAQRLRRESIGPQERVAFLDKNNDRFYEIWFGALKVRAVLTPVNFRLAAPEIAFILRDARPKILFVGRDFFEVAAKAVAELEHPPRIVSLDGAHGDWPDYAAWRDQAEPVDPQLPGRPDDDVIQLYTSGTTGHPKGVLLTNESYLAYLRAIEHVEGFRYQPDETVLNAMPLFHVGGTNVGLAGLARGSRLIVVRDLVPAALLDLIAREQVNHAHFVPAVILMLMNAPEIAGADLSSLRTITYGASPIAEDLLLRAQRRFGCNFVQFYGMTETIGAGLSLPPAAHDAAKGKLRSCGVPWLGIEVKLVDAQGREVADGQVGEIIIRTPTAMKSYHNNPAATRETLRDGWIYTGDAAYRDADGYFFIYDRVKDMIVTGGENVYPTEVENAIFGHPAIADVAVIGVPDATWGEAVKAIVVLKSGADANPVSIIAWARERVANYKVPKTIDFVASIPRNAAGKVLRRELRKPYWEGRERMVS